MPQSISLQLTNFFFFLFFPALPNPHKYPISTVPRTGSTAQSHQKFAMSYTSEKPPKIVYVNTQFVETDAGSFKSVVQRLTGKDSVLPTNPAASACEPPKNQPVIHETPAVSAPGGPLFPEAVSCKDIDRLFTELQPPDELFRLWSD